MTSATPQGRADGIAPVIPDRAVPATPPAGTDRAPDPPAGAHVAGSVSPGAEPVTPSSTRLPVAARAAAGMPDPVPGSVLSASGQAAAGDRAGQPEAPAAAFSARAAAGHDPAGSGSQGTPPLAGQAGRDAWKAALSKLHAAQRAARGRYTKAADKPVRYRPGMNRGASR